MLESSGRDGVYGHLRELVLHSFSTVRSTSPRDADLPLTQLELNLFLLCLGLFESALKLRGLGGVTNPPCPFPLP